MYDKNGAIIATSMTNLEIHDIARTCMTFGIDLCYIVTPLARQRAIMRQLIDHWESGYGATYNPIRGQALSRVRIGEDVEGMIGELSSNGKPLVIGTSSRERPGKMIGYGEVLELAEKGTEPVHILFGTGWGLADSVVDLCEKMLVPIKGKGNYNHLSLRVALGITLDRIFGERGGRDERTC